MMDSQNVDDPTYVERADGMYRKSFGKYVKCCVGFVIENNTKRQCKSPAISGSQYCTSHGSQALQKLEKPQYLAHLFQKERKRFKRIGKDLLEKVDNYRDDPDLFSLRDDTAYITALMDTRAEAAAEGVGLEQYRKVEAAYSLAKSKLGSPDFIDAFEQIGDLLDERMDEYSASKDVIELIGRRSDLVEAEQRIMMTKAYTLEADQAFMLIMQIVDAIKSSIRDVDSLNAIQGSINKILHMHNVTQEVDIQDAVIVGETDVQISGV
jgi:hypothetical protein